MFVRIKESFDVYDTTTSYTLQASRFSGAEEEWPGDVLLIVGQASLSVRFLL